jgi:hypothetical protein
MHGELSTLGLSLQIEVYGCGQLYRANRKIRAQTRRLAIQFNRVMNRKMIYILIYDYPVKIVFKIMFNLVQVIECSISGQFLMSVTIIIPRNYFNASKYASALLAFPV